MRVSRLMQMEDYIMSMETVTIEALCDKFQVSKNTVRRDLDALCKKGAVRKIYGGAASSHARDTVPFEERNVKNIRLKEQIARKAAEFIHDGDSIFIDSGTTLTALYYQLPQVQNLTIFTNNMEVAFRSLSENNYRIILTGGELSRSTCSATGTDASRMLDCYNIEKAFLSAVGVSVENGATNSSRGEFEVKQAMVRRSKYRYLLVDSSKFDSVSLMTFADLNAFDAVITDTEPSGKYQNYLKKNNVDLIIT